MTLKVQDLNQFYGSSHCLKNINFDVEQNSCIGVLGLNGAGKTTLAKSLMGINEVKSGSISIDGSEISELAPNQRVDLGLGYVPQGREIFSDLSIDENLRIGESGEDKSNLVISRSDIFQIFPVLKQMLNRRGGDLSGGQQQQLSIARALMTNPTILILDEPTEGIQPSIVTDIRSLIFELKGKFTIILIEQYIEFAKAVCDDYIVLARGEICASGSKESLNSKIESQFLKV